MSKNPDDQAIPTETIFVEPSQGGYWSYYDHHRSPGTLPDAPLNQFLRWILEQISLGHSLVGKDEDGDVVSVTVGKQAPHKVSSRDEAAEISGKEHIAIIIAGAIAEAREKGCSSEGAGIQKQLWDSRNESMHRRMEIHYGLVFCELLGRVSKKLPDLELLPIIDSAPESTRSFLAEATRCYLLKMDRACIALCRASLEDTLKNILTPEMQDEWNDEASELRNHMQALINVCVRHGLLGTFGKDAHDVREEGNKILHWKEGRSEKTSEVATKVLMKTRVIIGFIYGNQGLSH